jgi:hypothetical protein
MTRQNKRDRIDPIPPKRASRTQLKDSDFYKQNRYFFTGTFPGLVEDVTPEKKGK